MDERPGMETLGRLLTADRIDMSFVCKHLDEAPEAQRMREVSDLGRLQLARLFAEAEGQRRLELAHLVPAHRAALEEVVFIGKNSLPVFTSFAKVFCRPDLDAESEDLWGYNRNPSIVATFVGPGYFTVRVSREAPGELVIDYARLPPRRPASWPDIVPNDKGLSRFVYNGTMDVLRGVSADVCIGRAHRRGHPMNAWFILCRSTG